MKNYLIALFLFIANTSWANNLKITNISNTSNTVTFDLSWENSWYTPYEPYNWDAVWIIVKAQDCNSYAKSWLHSKIDSTQSTHTSSNNKLKFETVADQNGVFIRRKDFGFGAVATSTITLQLAQTYTSSNMNFSVHGIEMVYVSQGAFEVGLGGQYSFKDNANSSLPGKILSEDEIPASTLMESGVINSNHPVVRKEFPKGFAAFYCMKYEITQGQYVSFLNHLNYRQQTARTEHAPSGAINSFALTGNLTTMQNRNGVKLKQSGNVLQPAVYGMDLNNNGVFDEVNDGENIACNFISLEDILSYLDWIALRPMSELEFEKAARGPESAVVNQYAYGNNTIPLSVRYNTLSNGGAPNEKHNYIANPKVGVATFAANFTSTYIFGPTRVGQAADQTSDRERAGASYYGILDLSGNIYELTVSIGYNALPTSFTDTTFKRNIHGDGNISDYGIFNEPSWFVLNGINTIARGGSFSSPQNSNTVAPKLTIGDRSMVTENVLQLSRNSDIGGRGVRSVR